MTDRPTHGELLALTTDIVSAYVANHSVPAQELTGVIHQVFEALHDLREGKKSGSFGVRPDPAVPIEQSVTDDYIVCLEDGKQLQMLKRHLKTVYNMTVEQYRERWGLASDYPVVSPNYARRRSEIAKSSGLGMSRGPRKPKVVDPDLAMRRAVNL